MKMLREKWFCAAFQRDSMKKQGEIAGESEWERTQMPLLPVFRRLIRYL